jgi:mono-ADP-ribosyltransferase sirtuin 6
MPFAEQLRARKANLRPTETIVRPMPVCQSGLEHQGLSCLGGEIEHERLEEEATTVELARTCAHMLQRARHTVVYTGAGISTATGISDYRGPDGVWTCLATGRIPDDSFDWTAATPSFAHMCIAKLMELGFVKFCTSTNLDALHYKSGLTPLDNLAELHGNKYVERCAVCSKDVLRSFPIRRSATRETGRVCECGGPLTGSGIDFRQALPVHHLSLAQKHAMAADFSLVVGTSMRVRPACDLPVCSKKVAPDGVCGRCKASMCIVHRMDTGLDERASIRSYGDADVFFGHLVNELGIEVDTPSPCKHLYSAMQMKALASKLLPPSNGHYVGVKEKEEQMAEALTQVETELLARKTPGGL